MTVLTLRGSVTNIHETGRVSRYVRRMADRIFHLSYPRMKHEENSNRGDKEAVRKRFNATDHDWQKNADGIVYNTHWKDVFRRDKFKDPKRQFGRGDKFHTLHKAVVERLIAVTNGKEYHIRTAAEGIRHAAQVGLDAVYGEAKPGNVWTVADFRYHKQVADKAGIRLVIETMDNWPGWKQTLANAEAAGCKTRRLRKH